MKVPSVCMFLCVHVPSCVGRSMCTSFIPYVCPSMCMSLVPPRVCPLRAYVAPCVCPFYVYVAPCMSPPWVCPLRVHVSLFVCPLRVYIPRCVYSLGGYVPSVCMSSLSMPPPCVGMSPLYVCPLHVHVPPLCISRVYVTPSLQMYIGVSLVCKFEGDWGCSFQV